MTICKSPKPHHGPDEQKNTHSFGGIIRKYRSRLKYNQRDLGRLMDVNQNTVCNWETDKNQPDAQALRKLCLLLDIPLYELFGIETNTANYLRASSGCWPFTALWTSTARRIWKPLQKP